MDNRVMKWEDFLKPVIFNEMDFQKVYKQMATEKGLNPDPDNPLHYYDYRALYKETGKLESDKTGHFPSKYKLEGHKDMIVDSVNTKTGEKMETEWNFPKPAVTRGQVSQEKQAEGKWSFPKPKTSSTGALPDTHGIAPQQVEAPKEEPYPGTPQRIAASLYSNLFERSLYNATNVVMDITGKEGLQPPVTTGMEKQYAYERVEAKEKGFFAEVSAEIIPALEGLFGVLTQVRGIGALLAGTGAIALGTKPSAYKPLTQMAAYRLLTSKGTAGERVHQAAFTTAASITPLIINKTGATGFGAVACDTMLNMILSNKTYIDAINSAESASDFFKKVSAQLVIDIGLAWNTRGGTETQLKAAYDKYEKQANKLLTLKLKDFTDLVKVAEKFTKEEKSIERKLIPKFSTKQWQVRNEADLKKLGKALANEAGLGDWDISWEMSDKSESLYTGFALITHLQNKEALIHIYNPQSKGVALYETQAAGDLLGGIRGKTHGNLVKTILHELGHLGSPTAPKLDRAKYATKEGYRKAYEQKGHDEKFHEWTEEHRSDLWKEKETVKESVARRLADMQAEEKGQPLLTDKEQLQYIPDLTRGQELVAKMKSIFGVQSPLKDAGAPETGFALKNFPNMVAYGHNKGLLAIKEIVSMAKKAGIPKGSFGEFAEITYAAESGKYRDTMTPEALAKIQPMIDAVNVFYKQWELQFKEIGWMEVPFPQSLINRNLSDIKDLESKLKGADGSQTKSIQKEIDGLKDINERISEENMSFVSVPIRMILRDKDAAITKHFMSLVPKWGRKTITIKDLVEEGVITEQEAELLRLENIISTIANNKKLTYLKIKTDMNT